MITVNINIIWTFVNICMYRGFYIFSIILGMFDKQICDKFVARYQRKKNKHKAMAFQDKIVIAKYASLFSALNMYFFSSNTKFYQICVALL